MQAKTRADWWYQLTDARLSRRDLLRVARDVGALISLGAASSCLPRRSPTFRSQPFTLGVASGDPWPDGVVLWTRIARNALAESGVPDSPLDVGWELAADDSFRRVVQRGSAAALPELGHSVHVEVAGLQPGRPYWYRFHAGNVTSVVGRTCSAPAAGASVDRLRFAFVSCQNYEHGFFTALQHLSAEELDLIVHLGDYIYERAFTSAPQVRQHEAAEVRTLEEYRGRYAHYRSDGDLQSAHASTAWLVTTDDHEVVNNYAGETPSEEDPETPAQLLLRRAAAYQAYYEFMPLRRSARPQGSSMPLFRRLDWGRLARFHVLDTRQYRTDQPCGDKQGPRCEGALTPAATMMGAAQENWLYDGMRGAQTGWNVLANQVMIAQLARVEANGRTFSMDKWDGYVVARQRLLDFLRSARPANPVVLTGDIHSNWVADLKLDFDDPASPIMGAEFVGTSISSGGDGRVASATAQAQLQASPHVHFHNAQRGYVRCTVTPSLWTADYRVISYVSRRGAPVATLASFAVRAGVPGVQRVDSPAPDQP